MSQCNATVGGLRAGGLLPPPSPPLPPPTTLTEKKSPPDPKRSRTYRSGPDHKQRSALSMYWKGVPVPKDRQIGRQADRQTHTHIHTTKSQSVCFSFVTGVVAVQSSGAGAGAGAVRIVSASELVIFLLHSFTIIRYYACTLICVEHVTPPTHTHTDMHAQTQILQP